MNSTEKAALLRQVIELLEQVDVLQQRALGATDVCFENSNRIVGLIDDFETDISELEAA